MEGYGGGTVDVAAAVPALVDDEGLLVAAFANLLFELAERGRVHGLDVEVADLAAGEVIAVGDLHPVLVGGPVLVDVRDAVAAGLFVRLELDYPDIVDQIRPQMEAARLRKRGYGGIEPIRRLFGA